jgi:hypothetical protein
MKKIVLLALALVLALSLVACGGNTDTPSGGGNSTTPPASNNGGNTNDSLFDISKSDVTMLTSSLDKDAVFAEIPADMFKGIGTLNSAEISADTISDYKYVVVLKFYVKSDENAVKTLMDFYKSKGATVEETGNTYNPYSVKFDWGESTEVKFGTFEGKGYVDLQFSVVK